jgi:hypothetical protein
MSNDLHSDEMSLTQQIDAVGKHHKMCSLSVRRSSTTEYASKRVGNFCFRRLFPQSRYRCHSAQSQSLPAVHPQPDYAVPSWYCPCHGSMACRRLTDVGYCAFMTVERWSWETPVSDGVQWVRFAVLGECVLKRETTKV